MTQDALSRALDISISAVGMWETGKRQPDYDTLKKISNFFGVSSDYLIDNDLSSQMIQKEENEKELLLEISNNINEPLNKELYKKIGKLKNTDDKKKVSRIIDVFME